MIRFVDTHLHIDRLGQPETELQAARERGVAHFVIPGVRPRDWPELMACLDRYPGTWAAPGVHPLAAGEWRDEHTAQLCALAEDPRVVAIGEVGLDRKVDIPMEHQEALLRRMIRLARTLGRPLLVHYRQATGRLLEILAEEGAERVGGIIHAYSGSLQTARQLIDMGFVLGIGGIITYPEARRLPLVVQNVPAESLVLETDAPYLAPHPCRDQPNHPANLILVAETVAGLRGWTLEETAHITTQNAQRILRIP